MRDDGWSYCTPQMRVEIVTGDFSRVFHACTALIKNEMARRFIAQFCLIKFHARSIWWLSIYVYPYRRWRDREILEIRSDAHASQI
jgi:hypothetical protein